MSFRRMAPFLLLNILVSATVVLAILYWWDGRNSSEEVTAVTTPTTLTANPTPDLTLPTAPDEGETAVEPVAEAANEGPTIHTVQPGDTLGSISTRYDVPLEDIMTANSIANPNILSVGQELLIPLGGLATPTAVGADSEIETETAVADAPPTPIATEPPPEQGEANVEVSGVIAPGSLTEEAVQIINSGSRQINLAGWTLQDEFGFVYTFGQVTLFGEGAGILIHTETGADGPTDLFWGLESPVWQPGETVTLSDATGSIRATFVIP